MKRFKNILCVLELKGISKPALQRAVSLAENNQAGLTVVCVTPDLASGLGMPAGGPISTDLQEVAVKHLTQQIDTLVEPFINRIDIETRVLIGTPFLQIIREVLRHEHDLVIKVPEQRDWLDRFFSSDDMHILRKCPCPVWFIKPQPTKHFHRILAAVDVNMAHPSDELESRHVLNRQILEIAFSLSLHESAELHIVHVWDAIAENAMRHGAFISSTEYEIDSYIEQVRRQHDTSLKDLLREMADFLGQDNMQYIKPKMHLIKGWARKEIPELAKRIETDLVVMGTVAHTGIPGFIMGNTAETVLNQIDSSVLAVKPPGFETPVTLE